VKPALQIYSRDFDADFYKLPPGVQRRIETAIDWLGRKLETHSHHRLKGVDAFRVRVVTIA
jgi:hypothetical protein